VALRRACVVTHRSKKEANITVVPEHSQPFFIVGSGRSGTTLLRLILVGHSQIEIPPETWFILPLVRELPIHELLTKGQVQRAIDIITNDYRWPDMGMTADALGERAHALPSPRIVDIINIVYRQHLSLARKPRFGDKTPPYIEIVPQLRELYPGAKFIHLVRDGRDVAVSYIELKWHEKGYRCYERDFDWTRSLRFRESYRHTALNEHILDVKYEDLVCDPEPTIRRICNFIGESFEPHMLEWNDRKERVPVREMKIHGKLGQPLSAGATGRWRGKLSAFECFITESCLERDLRRWGYDLHYSSWKLRPLLKLTGSLLLAMGPLLVKVIPYLKRRHLLPQNIYF